jgi:hypothetical protein
MSLPDAARPAAMALRDQSAVRPLPPISTSTGHTQAHRREKGGLAGMSPTRGDHERRGIALMVWPPFGREG